MRRHVLLMIAVSYVVTATIVQAAVGRPWLPLFSATLFTVPALVVSVVYFAVLAIRFPSGVPAFRSRLLSGVLFLSVVIVMQGAFHALKMSIGHVIGFPWDRTLADLDAALHGGDPWRWLTPLLSTAALKAVDRLYGAWAVLSLALTVWCAFTIHPLRDRARLAWLLVWIVAGSAGAWAFASAGPCYYEAVTGDRRFAPLLDRIAAEGLVARIVQHMAWDIHATDTITVPFAGVSAAPSMHVAGIIMVTIIGWARNRRVGLILAPYALLIQLSSVALGWHYAIDGYLGAVAAFVCWWLAGRLTRPATQAAFSG